VDEGRRLALSVDWWVIWRSQEPVSSALMQAHLLHWVPAVSAILERNKRKKAGIHNWSQLADQMHRDLANLYRMRVGEYTPNARDFLTLSTLLDIPVERFYPTKLDWLAGAAQLLWKGGSRLGRQWTPDASAYAYTEYILSRAGSHDDQLDKRVLKTIHSSRHRQFLDAKGLERSILEVADGVGRQLMKVHMACQNS